jgi:hypothetical protein
MSDIVFAATADFTVVADGAPLLIEVPAQGPRGLQGEAGAAGTAGSNGANGAAGMNALVFTQGAGAPDDGDGVNGDFYINTANGDLYKKAAGTWGAPFINIVGPAGANGTDGIFSAIASQAEAEAGSDNAKGMTALRVAQAIAALASAVPSGTVVFTILASAPAGWLLFADQTIGDASSGASYANALAQTVFTALFDNATDANCPLFTSAGGATTRAAQTDAATAWAAHCRMSMPKALGRALAVSGSGAGLTARALAAAVGEEAHVLSVSEMPTHNHALPFNTSGGGGSIAGLPAATGSVSNVNSSNSGSDNAHNTMQPTTFLNAMVKL